MAYPHSRLDQNPEARHRPPSACASRQETLIQDHITKYFEARIPDSAYDTHEKFVAAIKERAVPFRLMDLPPELRIQIIELSLDDPDSAFKKMDNDGHGALVRIKHANYRGTGLPTPLIARTTRNLRAESLPVFYARVELNIGDNVGQKMTGRKFVTRVRKAANRIGPDVARMLRRVAFGVEVHPREMDIDSMQVVMVRDMKRGLRIETEMKLRHGEDLLEQLAEDVGAAARKGGLGGEAIFTAIVRRPQLWDTKAELLRV